MSPPLAPSFAGASNLHTSHCLLRGIRPPFRTLNACQNLLPPRLARRAQTAVADAIRRIRGDPQAAMSANRLRQHAVNHMRVPALRRPHLRAANAAPLTRSQPLSPPSPLMSLPPEPPPSLSSPSLIFLSAPAGMRLPRRSVTTRWSLLLAKPAPVRPLSYPRSACSSAAACRA